MMVTGLQGHIQGSRLSLVACIFQGVYFCMGGARFPVVTLSHYLATFDHHCTHHGVGGSMTNTTGGQTEG